MSAEQSPSSNTGRGEVVLASATSYPAASGAVLHSPVARRRRRIQTDTLWAIIIISPSILAVLIFIYGFIAWTGYISLVNWNDVTPTYSFVGLQNYVRLFFNTPRFIIDLKNTVVFSVVFIGQCLVLGLLLAILLDQHIKGEVFFRTVFVLPFAISAIVTGVAWKWLMNPSSGIDTIFGALHLDFLQNKWFADPHIGIAATAIAAAWQMSGYTMALYLAGLRSISAELREAVHDRWRQRLPVLPLRCHPARAAGHADRADHPRYALAPPVRPARVHDLERTRVRNRLAGVLHVSDHLPAVQVFAGRGDRLRHVDPRTGPHRSLLLLGPPGG